LFTPYHSLCLSFYYSPLACLTKGGRGAGSSRRSFSGGERNYSPLACLAEGGRGAGSSRRSFSEGGGVLARLVKGGKILSHNKLPTPLLISPQGENLPVIPAKTHLSFPCKRESSKTEL